VIVLEKNTLPHIMEWKNMIKAFQTVAADDCKLKKTNMVLKISRKIDIKS